MSLRAKGKILLTGLTMLAGTHCISALADGLTPPMPYEVNARFAGKVNVVTWVLSMDHDDISVGAKDDSSFLSLSRNITNAVPSDWTSGMFGDGHTSSLHIYIDPNLTASKLTTGLTAIAGFTKEGRFEFLYNASDSVPTYTDAYQKGMALIVDSSNSSAPKYSVTNKKGDTYIFICDLNHVVDAKTPSSSHSPTVYWLSEIDNADGSNEIYKYEAARSDGGNTTAARLKSISNSFGFGLVFRYINSTVGGSFDLSKSYISQIDGVSAGCNISLSTCTPTILYSVRYSYNSVGITLSDGYGATSSDYYMNRYTDVLGNFVQYGKSGPGPYGYSIWSGGNVYSDLSAQVEDAEYTLEGSQNDAEIRNAIVNLTDGKQSVYNFSYNISNKYDHTNHIRKFDNTMTVTDPNGSKTYYHNTYQLSGQSDYSTDIPNVDLVTDDNGKKTGYGYDSYGRLTSITYPEGNIEYQVLDSRGNATESHSTAKPTSSLGDIFIKRDFLTCTSTNLKICNKADYIVDARGNQNPNNPITNRTDYTYDPAHGGVITETGPADSSGNRPLTTYSYAAFTGVDGATFYRLTSKVAKLDNSHNTSWAFAYDTSNHWFLKQISESDGSSTHVTCLKHDSAGNLISKTSPNAGIQICS